MVYAAKKMMCKRFNAIKSVNIICRRKNKIIGVKHIPIRWIVKVYSPIEIELGI